MRRGAVIPLKEIERRFLECLASRYMSQRELAGAYQVREHLKRRAFMYHARRLVRAMGDCDQPLTSMVRYKIGREYYWCRADDPGRGELALSAALRGHARNVFNVALLDVTPRWSPSMHRYVLGGWPPRSPVPQIAAVFYKTANGRLEAIRPVRRVKQKPMRLAWLPAELWDAVAAAPKRVRYRSLASGIGLSA